MFEELNFVRAYFGIYEKINLKFSFSVTACLLGKVMDDIRQLWSNDDESFMNLDRREFDSGPERMILYIFLYFIKQSKRT